MKRFILPSIVVLILGVVLLPATTYTYVVRELSQTFTAIQTFSAGFTSPSVVANTAPSGRGGVSFPLGVRSLGPAAMVGLHSDTHGEPMSTIYSLANQYNLPFTFMIARSYAVGGMTGTPPHTSGNIMFNSELQTIAANPIMEIGTHGSLSHSNYLEWGQGKVLTDGGTSLKVRAGTPGFDNSILSPDIVANDFAFLYNDGGPVLISSITDSSTIVLNRNAPNTGSVMQNYAINRSTLGTSLSTLGTFVCDTGAGSATLSWSSNGLGTSPAYRGFLNRMCQASADPYACCTGSGTGTCDADNPRIGAAIWIDNANPATGNPFYILDYSGTSNSGTVTLDRSVICTSSPTAVHVAATPLETQTSVADAIAWIRHDLGNPSFAVTSFSAPSNQMSAAQIMAIVPDGIRAVTAVVEGSAAGFNPLDSFSRWAIERDSNTGVANRWLAAPEGLRNQIRATEDTGAVLGLNFESGAPDADCYVANERMSGTSGGTTATCSSGSCSFCGLTAGDPNAPYYLVVDTAATARSYKISAFPGSGQLTVTPAFDGTFTSVPYWIVRHLRNDTVNGTAQLPKQTMDALFSFIASERDAGRIMPMTLTALADRASTMRSYGSNIVQNPNYREIASSCDQDVDSAHCKGGTNSTAYAPWLINTAGDKVSVVQRGGHSVLKIDCSGGCTGATKFQMQQTIQLRPNADYVGWMMFDVDSLSASTTFNYSFSNVQFAPVGGTNDNSWTPSAGDISGRSLGFNVAQPYYAQFRISTRPATNYSGIVAGNAITKQIGMSNSPLNHSGTGVYVIPAPIWPAGTMQVTPVTAGRKCRVTNNTRDYTVSCFSDFAETTPADSDFDFFVPAPVIDSDDSTLANKRATIMTVTMDITGVVYIHPIVILAAPGEKQSRI